MNKEFAMQSKDFYEADDPELNRLAAIVNRKHNRKKRAIPKKGFAY